MKIFILLAMIFCHIVDDYYLQGILAKLKQKSFWQNDEVGKQSKYKYDYIVALIMHSFSWAFMIMLPIAVFLKIELGLLFLAYPINMLIHGIVDDLKVNKMKINLCVDQTIHILQIVATWVVFMIMI